MKDVKEYRPLIYGKFTRFEAGVIYRAMKEEKIKVLPETITTLYNGAAETFGYYTDRYNQDHDYYDKIYRATQYILDGEYEKAQKQLTLWENDNIELAGRKSIFYKYKKGE